MAIMVTLDQCEPIVFNLDISGLAFKMFQITEVMLKGIMVTYTTLTMLHSTSKVTERMLSLQVFTEKILKIFFKVSKPFSKCWPHNSSYLK